MKPVNHPSNTRTLAAPIGWNQSGLPVEPLGITDTEIDGVPCVLSFWKPDDVDLANIAAGGFIGLSIVGRTMPPAAVITFFETEPARPDEPPAGTARVPAPAGTYDHTSCSDFLRSFFNANGRAPTTREAYRAAFEAGAAQVPSLSDAAVLLGKYKKLCIESKRGDGYHLARIDKVINSLSVPAAGSQPSQQGTK